MITTRFGILLLLAATTAGAADLPTADELRARAYNEERRNAQRDERVDANNASKSIPTEPTSRTGASPQSRKFVNTGDGSSTPTRNPKRSAAAPDSPVSNVPPQPSSSTGAAVKLDVAAIPPKRFGIRIGTMIPCEVRRNLNSTEPRPELWTTRDVVGDKRTLGGGTQIFGRGAINAATKRYDYVSDYAIDPDGYEFEIFARVQDTNRLAGLPGIVTDNTQVAVQKGVNTGLIAAGKGALQSLTDSPVARAVGAGGSAMLGEVDHKLQQETDVKLTIDVFPQPCLLRVEKTF